MIRLSKNDLVDFASVVVLANTPLSLFKGMVECSGMKKLRKCPPLDLITYYDYVTARRGRSTEVVAGLAYAVLCALILHKRESSEIRVDASRLQWGERIWEFMSRTNIGTSRITLTTSTPAPKISSFGSPSAKPTIPLYGPDGRPLA
jgi:hypothetical protein